ncbi:MAG: sodium ion-translocating decarboxylase subunit beta [Clostridia bacterium]|nr:sodium ion-translocating decarboxylase subunit beta [Clostridia bacterium]
MDAIKEAITSFYEGTGINSLIANPEFGLKTVAMWIIIGVLFYLGIVKKFEPLLLIPIATGMLLANLPGANLIHLEFFFDDYYITQFFDEATGTNLPAIFQEQINSFIGGLNELRSEALFANLSDADFSQIFGLELVEGTKDYIYKLNLSNLTKEQITAITDLAQVCFNNGVYFSSGAIHVEMNRMITEVINHGGLIDILYLGVKLGIYPSLIFLGVGAMTDFTALIANPKSLMLGAAAQLGVFVAFFGALFLGFSEAAAAAIGIIGGADGPTAILVTKILSPENLGAIAIAAYSYMALIPMIQPPLMKLVTTKKERSIVMTNLRPVSKTEKVLFPILVTVVVVLLVPDAAPLVGFLMFGNLLNVCGATERLSKTAQNELINIVTIMLGVSVGATANASNFLSPNTIKIIFLGLAAFSISTLGGLLLGKLMCFLTKGKINPLIGSAGVSAVPMAARVSQDVGRKENPANFLLMHAMGPNVAGVIGSAVAAGVFLSLYTI